MEKDNQDTDQEALKLITLKSKEALVRNTKERSVRKLDDLADTLDKNIVTKMELEIEDVGQEKLLPSFTGGKERDEVCSLRWLNLTSAVIRHVDNLQPHLTNC